MNFFISDTEFESKQRNKWGTVSKVKNKFGKWYYRFEDCQVYKTDTRVIIYSGYTDEKTINEYIKTDPYSLKYANGDFCVAILEKETMEVFADYICQTKFINDDWIHGRKSYTRLYMTYPNGKFVHVGTNNQSYMMPATTSNINTHKFNIMKDYNKHWINKYDSFDVTDSRWQEAKNEIQKTIRGATRNICRIIDAPVTGAFGEWEDLTCTKECRQYKVPSKHLMEAEFVGGFPASSYYSKYVMDTSGTIKTIKEHFICSTRKLILLNQIHDKKFINRNFPCSYELGFYQKRINVPTNKLMSKEYQQLISEVVPVSTHVKRIQHYMKQYQSGKDPTIKKPILVTQKGSDYLILDGQHRYFAAKQTDTKTVNVAVIPSILSFYIRICFQYKNSGTFMYNDKQTMIIPTYELSEELQKVYASGDKYVGKFMNDKYNGQGTYTWTLAKKKYVGQWKDSMQHGWGTMTWANGTKYVGGYKDSEKDGLGTYTFASGDKYVGKFMNDKYNGQGTYTWALAKKEYVGQWKDSIQHGRGTLTYASGDKYVGEFKNSTFHGQGTFTYANGDKYVGEWKDDKRA